MTREEAANFLDEGNNKAWEGDPPEIFALYEATCLAIDALRRLDEVEAWVNAWVRYCEKKGISHGWDILLDAIKGDMRWPKEEKE